MDVVDAGERLQADAIVGAVTDPATEIVPIAAHGEGCGTNAAAEIEGEDLRASVAPELQGHQGQQHGLAGAGRADDQCMSGSLRSAP
jgi:hypothetical protein